MEKFLVIKDNSKHIQRFGVTGRKLEFKLRPVPRNAEPVEWIKAAINEIVHYGTEKVKSNDMIGFSFCSNDFSRGEGWMNFKRADEINSSDVWDMISRIYQSNSTGLNTETFCLGITTVEIQKGSGRGQKYNTFEEECAARRGIVTIKNNDNWCLPRALVVAKAFIDKDPLYSDIRDNKRKIQDEKAGELLSKCCMNIPEEGCSISEIECFQRYLKKYQIVVYKYGENGRNIIYKGPAAEKKINLLHHNNHFNVITSLTGTFACSYYCEECHIPYNNKLHHRCGGICPACQSSPPCQFEMKKVCDQCNRSFRGQTCFDNHLKELCGRIRRCEECLKIIRKDRTHKCGEIFCKICRKHQPSPHYCFIQKDTKKPSTDVLFIFYDLETRQEKQRENGSLLHEPNLCVFQQRCLQCIDELSTLNYCQKCGYRRKILEGKDVISQFMTFILTQRKLFRNVIILAHNNGGFDGQFMLNHILMNTSLTPQLIMRGTKLISMIVENVKFLDSLNYFPMALAALPKAFGFSEMKKGFFPHLFNREENQNYVGPIPDVKYYDPDSMKTEKREEFLKWYIQAENYVFNFQRELVEYCTSDTQILTEACLKFRELMLKETNVCPFTEACTIASACNKVFRRNFLQPDTIGIIPKNGYRLRDNQSRIALQWLEEEAKNRHINIQHSGNNVEAVINGVKVDGFCTETKQVFEFNGCYFHGCPKCFKYNRDKPLHDDHEDTLDRRYERTCDKIQRLRDKGYEVFEKWGCDYNTPLQDKPDIPLDPREAFYGGRTGNTRTYYNCKEGEKIKYLDVCSLYPWICKRGKFVIGHPTQILVGNENCSTVKLNNSSGLIKCKILPPTNLYHPVLPMKMNNKLMFILCQKCGQSQNKKECNHSDSERALMGTWIIEEVAKALEVGYKMMEIYEIWKYDTVQFDRETPGLFTRMMDKFIKIKQEASGWPQHCRTETEKNRYIEMFLQMEDVNLEFNKICSNPGLRALAKLMLNSFWGKFGQRENQIKTKIINDPSEFFSMMTSPHNIINNILPVNENVIIVNYEERFEAYDPLTTVNVAIAAYVTAQARLKLYSYLENLGERVLYYDTDSVIFVSREGDWEPPTGEFIGDMTDELIAYGPGSYITEFVSGGPKNYAYKLWSTANNEFKTVCKVKGISLTYAADQLVNFETIKQSILNPSDPILVCGNQIRRTKEHEVITLPITKIYQPNSTKRQFHEDGTSVPYGFKRMKF